MGKLRALIVEDDRDLAQLFSMALKEAGFETEIAYTGDSAIEQLQTGEPPDVVVLDLYLPHVGGKEVLDRIRSDARLEGTQVIIATAGVRAAELLHDQAEIVLVKPVDFTQLRDLAARLVRQKPS
ncbi:MAG: response regulator [Anaerolineae bacterium]|nr:response regulator [Anaerolineae bacterium]